MAYFPETQVYPTEVENIVCCFYYQSEWHLSRAAIYQEAEMIRETRTEEEWEAVEDGDAYNELLRSAARYAYNGVLNLIKSIQGFHSLSDYLEYSDPSCVQRIKDKTRRARLTIIQNAGQDLSWLLSDTDRSSKVSGITFEDCCYYESAAIDVDSVREDLVKVVEGWLANSPAAVEALKKYISWNPEPKQVECV